ncbi:AAWKG family protein [Streptomyces humi]|uniref:AAWKG family protein n=1 Tax=Streptomyces humi TaxID=1428620 RepID=UPI0006286D1B|nr:AAWKG family protein [Streptomyces humi]
MAVQSWEDILHLLTGWSLVKRTDVTDVTGDSGMPWINYTFKRGGLTFDSDDDFFAWIVPQNPNKGFHFEFYTAGGGVRKCRVDITYIDSPAFHGYWGNSNAVLSDLLTQHSSVKGDIGDGGDSAPDVDGVKLSTFAELAWSFDAAGDFFKQQTAVLADWKQQLGSEQASWKGNAAGAFWLLVDDLHKKYENYTSQLQPPGFSPQHRSPTTGFVSKTLHGDDLIGAEESLYKAYTELHKIYNDFYWQQGKPVTTTLPDGSTTQQQIAADPLDVLNQVFVEIGRWIIDNNARRIGTPDPDYLSDVPAAPVAETKEGFSENITWGGLTDAGTWHAAAKEAVQRWTSNVETNLDAPSRQVLETLQKDWSRVLDSSWNPAFSFTDTSSSLTSDVQSESSDSSNNSLNDNLKKLGDGLNNLGGGLNNLGGGINDGFNNLGDGLNNSFSHLGDGLDNVGNGLSNGLSNLTGNGGFSNFSASGNGGLTDGLGGGLGGGDGQSTNIPDISGNGGFGSGLPDTSTLTGDGGGTGFGSGLPISNIDGSTTSRTGNGVTTTYPNGNTVTRNADGSITSTFSDGTSRTVSPDGDVTTVDAQGNTTTSHLGVGESLGNPDGTSITRNGDGSLTQTATDGTKTTTFSNGASEIVTPDGNTQLTSPDGTVSHVNSDGSLTTDNPDGSKITVHPNGDVTTVDAQGHTTTSHLDTGKSITTGDGSTITVDGKGDIVTHNPDGSSTTLHPDGTITTTQATSDHPGGNGNGTLTTPHIDIPTYSGGGQTTYTPDGTSVTSHPNGVTEYKHTDGSGLVTTSDGRFQSVPSPESAAAAEAAKSAAEALGGGTAAGVAAGAQAQAGSTDSQSAMGLLSPMMMMAGMNRMGGQQGGQGGGDRERNLYDGNDMDGAVVQHGMSPFGARTAPEEPAEWEEEETDSDELLGPRRPSTESGYGPAGGARQSTESAAWSGRNQDVWGTEEGGLPASIGH